MHTHVYHNLQKKYAYQPIQSKNLNFLIYESRPTITLSQFVFSKYVCISLNLLKSQIFSVPFCYPSLTSPLCQCMTRQLQQMLGGASEHRTVSVGPVHASARTTICNSKQEGEEFWNKKTLIAFTIVSAHCHCYNILVKKLFKGAPCSWIELPVQ